MIDWLIVAAAVAVALPLAAVELRHRDGPHVGEAGARAILRLRGVPVERETPDDPQSSHPHRW